MTKYIKPEIQLIISESEDLLMGSQMHHSVCNCGCEKSDIYPGYCTCNNGDGCPGCRHSKEISSNPIFD